MRDVSGFSALFGRTTKAGMALLGHPQADAVILRAVPQRMRRWSHTSACSPH